MFLSLTPYPLGLKATKKNPDQPLRPMQGKMCPFKTSDLRETTPHNDLENDPNSTKSCPISRPQKDRPLNGFC